MHRRVPCLALTALAAALLAAVPASPAAAAPRAGKGPVRVNELQVIGTHNSYKRELSEPEQATYDEIIATPGARRSTDAPGMASNRSLAHPSLTMDQGG